MLGNSSSFFYQDEIFLSYKRLRLYNVLMDFEIENYQKFLDAFDYFCQNPSKFDGATIVKDLETIKGLDAAAMVHDWEYLQVKNWWTFKALKHKLIIDFEYGKHQEFTGKGAITPYTRTFLLWLSTPFYYLIYKL